MGAKNRRWKGSLAKPIREPQVIRSQGYLVVESTLAAENAAMRQAIDEAIARAWQEKLPLLFEHYGIEDKSDYFSLSLALAIDHVPGFAVKHVTWKLSEGDYGVVEPATKAGRHRDWTSERLRALLDAVEAVKRDKKVGTDREALLLLSRRKPWKAPANHRGEATQWVETLETRLQEAKKIDKKAKLLAEGLSEIKGKFEP
jgi:hypothetical protein